MIDLLQGYGRSERGAGSLDVEIPLDKSPVPWLSTGCLAGDTIALISPVFRIIFVTETHVLRRDI